jgi:protein O-mannosyl-transferase
VRREFRAILTKLSGRRFNTVSTKALEDSRSRLSRPSLSTPAQTRWICWALLLVTLVLFAPVRTHEFVNYDDPSYVTENTHVNRGLTKEGLVWAFTELRGESTYWHPITWMSHMLDCELFGLNPGGHHLVNVFVHALNAVLLFLVLQRMTGALWQSAMVAALFAWHPLQVDSVAWVAERKNLLSALFWILAMAAYVRYARNPRVTSYLLVLASYVAGLMCKPILVVLPCALLLLDFWPLKRWPGAQSPGATRSLRNLLLEKIPFFVLGAISSYITIQAHQELGSLGAASGPFSHRLANALVSYARYLKKVFWPDDLCVFYPYPDQWPITVVASSALLLLALTGFALWKARRAPYLFVGWFWFLGVLVPYIGLVQAGLQSMADRFVYLPIIGIFIAAVWSISDFLSPHASRIRPFPHFSLSPFLLIVLAACAVMTWRQLSYWHNSITLFTRALAVTTNNAPAHINLGVALETEGRTDEALLHYQEALRINPGHPQVHNNIGNILSAMGRANDAIAAYERALELRPGVALVHNNLGLALAAQARFDEAAVQYHEALRLRPSDPEPHLLLARLSLAQGKPQEAIEHSQAALRLNPDHAKALTYLARLRAASENATIRNGPQAVEMAERAVQLTAGQQPLALDVLAMAYAEIGRFEDAARVAQQALEYLTAASQEKDASEVQSRLTLYRARQPFRESGSAAP